MLVRLTTLLVVFSTTVPSQSRASHECNVISSKYFQWTDRNGTAYFDQPTFPGGVLNDDTDLPSNDCEEITGYQGCRYCSSRVTVVCAGSDSSIPPAESLPTTRLSVFLVSGLTTLKPLSFQGLYIEQLIVHNSNLSSFSIDTFKGVHFIKYLHLKDNTIEHLNNAEFLFQHMPDLKVLELKRNGLQTLTSSSPANLRNLKYFSISGNPIHNLNLYFLQNSALEILNFKNVKFRVNSDHLKNCGFSSLPNSLNTLDLNRAEISVKNLKIILESLSNKNLTVLNLGNLKTALTVDPFLLVQDVSPTLEYLSLEGTRIPTSLALQASEKDNIFHKTFYRLKEISMKNCGISDLGDGQLFQAFPNLRVLSLAGNYITRLNLKMFSYFHVLGVLDFSNSKISQIVNRDKHLAESLQVLDLSRTTLDLKEAELSLLFNATPNLQNLSLCGAVVTTKNFTALQNVKNLNLIDLSGTIGKSPHLLSVYKDLFSSGLPITELHFSNNKFEFKSDLKLTFSYLKSLKVLNLSNNWIRLIPRGEFGPTIEELVLSNNFITTWFAPVFAKVNQLKYLHLNKNQISNINKAMLEDFQNVTFLDLDFNPLMCHQLIVSIVCNTLDSQMGFNHFKVNGWHQNQCYDTITNNYHLFNEPKDCKQYFNEVSNLVKTSLSSSPEPTDSSVVADVSSSFVWVFILIGATLCTAMAGSIVYVKWWNIRCFIHRYFSLRKARQLKKDGEALNKADVHYDVFVSYSDTDRSWVLDHLIPKMEADGDISLCFHERDFQVGLSILENIIDSMDRSKAILLIVSSAFVRSKWCQFEMHLAQYRLIETYRDQLVLILLEDIPRKARPQTLHHLMMTKTYLIWPQDPCKEEARELFWKRLKRALKPTFNYILFDA